jgi:hypothetical protein
MPRSRQSGCILIARSHRQSKHVRSRRLVHFLLRFRRQQQHYGSTGSRQCPQPDGRGGDTAPRRFRRWLRDGGELILSMRVLLIWQQAPPCDRPYCHRRPTVGMLHRLLLDFLFYFKNSFDITNCRSASVRPTAIQRDVEMNTFRNSPQCCAACATASLMLVFGELAPSVLDHPRIDAIPYFEYWD